MLLGLGTGLASPSVYGPPAQDKTRQDKTTWYPPRPLPQNLWKQSSPGPGSKQVWRGWELGPKIGPGPTSDDAQEEEEEEELSSPKVL